MRNSDLIVFDALRAAFFVEITNLDGFWLFGFPFKRDFLISGRKGSQADDHGFALIDGLNN